MSAGWESIVVEAAGKPEGSEAKLNLGDAERRKATACGGWSMGGAGSRLAPVIDVYGAWQGREGVALSKRVDMRGSAWWLRFESPFYLRCRGNKKAPIIR